MEFSVSSSVLNNMLLVSKPVNNFIKKRPHVSSHIKFVLKKFPEKGAVLEHVRFLVIDKGKTMKDDATDEQITTMFPNVTKLELNCQIHVSDRIFEKLNSIESLYINSCPEIGNEGFKNLTQSLKKLVIDRSHYVKREEEFKISNEVFKYLPNLESLGIHSFWEFGTFGLLGLKKVKKFRTSRTNISSRVLKVWNDLEDLELMGISSWNAKRFRHSKKIRKLKILQCRRIQRDRVERLLKPFPDDFTFESPRPRRGRFLMPPPLSDSDEKDSSDSD